MNQPRRRATYDDVLNAPENVVAEIIDGELITTPRPGAPHALATSVIGADLVGAFGPPGDPGTIDRGRKMHIYARERIPHLWIVDPILRTLEVYRLAESGHWIVAGTHVGDDTARAEPFEEIELRIARWWTDAVAR